MAKLVAQTGVHRERGKKIGSPVSQAPYLFETDY